MNRRHAFSRVRNPPPRINHNKARAFSLRSSGIVQTAVYATSENPPTPSPKISVWCWRSPYVLEWCMDPERSLAQSAIPSTSCGRKLARPLALLAHPAAALGWWRTRMRLLPPAAHCNMQPARPTICWQQLSRLIYSSLPISLLLSCLLECLRAVYSGNGRDPIEIATSHAVNSFPGEIITIFVSTTRRGI